MAIATALMPPLCTAGYGLATFQFQFFYGAFYLYLINTVFIALATFIIVRLLHFPYHHLQNKKAEKMAHRIVWVVVLVTLLPSLYFGYDMVEQDKFTKNASRFITNEAHFPNDYLLNKKIDAKTRKITLVFGGKEIAPEEIEQLKGELIKYNLSNASLEVKQGFAYLAENENSEQNEQLSQLTIALTIKEENEKKLLFQMDSIKKQELRNTQLFAEIKAQYPLVKNAIIQPSVIIGDSTAGKKTIVILLSLSANLPSKEKIKLENWLKVRLNQPNIQLIFQR